MREDGLMRENRLMRESGATPTWPTILEELEAEGHALVRAWPRADDHLLVELDGSSGRVSGQWFAQPARAVAVSAETPGARQFGRVVLQPGGADRRLRSVADLARRPDRILVSHRPERRAVLAHRDAAGVTAYTKVVRRRRQADLVESTRWAAALPFRTPDLISFDHSTGAVTTSALPGELLHDLLPGPRAEQACRAAGRMLAELHQVPVPDTAPQHDPMAELAVIRRWHGLAETYGAVLAEAPESVDVTEITSGLDGPTRRSWIHRDLHDKQVLVDAAGDVGIIDFDLRAAGDPALDLANLLEHLELRERQGMVPDSSPWCAAVLEGYQPTADVVDRLPFYRATTRLRLASVYAFRPRDRVS